MKVFVTGGTGFIGSWVTRVLLDSGHEVTVLARNPNKIPAFRQLPRLHLVEGDLSDHAKLDALLVGHEACIHLALCWGNSPSEMLMRDTLNSVVLFEKAAAAGIAHFIYTSSTAAFGAFLPIMDETMRSDPVDYYCATKSASEAYLIATSYKTPMRCNIIRPGYTFASPVVPGAPMGPAGFRELMTKVKRGEDVTVMQNDGTQFIWAGDLAQVYRAVLESTCNREMYHALSVPWVSWEAVARLGLEKTGSKSTVIVTRNANPGKPRLFNLTHLQHDFGLVFDAWPHIVEHIEYLAQHDDWK